MCGENYSWDLDKRCDYGSPPRVRGKQYEELKAALEERITPACAGKTKPHPFLSHLSADHPRVCGENPSQALRIVRPRGSPPRVRGKQAFPETKSFRTRITPACAGKTWATASRLSATTDHPRVCGENNEVYSKTGY